MSLLTPLTMQAINEPFVADPYAANVVSLLHFDGADESTTFTDSVSGRTWTRSGNAKIDTAQSLFGGTSMYQDGSGDYITSDSSTDFAFGTGAFTVEGWAFFESTGSGTNPWLWSHMASGLGIYTGGGAIVLWSGSSNIVTHSMSFASAFRWRVERSGTTIHLYINGTSVGSSTYSTNMGTSAIRLGAHPSSAWYWKGWTDEVRHTKGVARCGIASSYTLDTEAFPDP